MAKRDFAFGKENFILIAVAVAVIIVSSHQFHCMDQKTFGINQQTDRIADQDKRYSHQHNSQCEQDNAQAFHIIVHHLHHILPVKQVGYRGICFDFLFDMLQAVRVCIFGMQLHFDRW